MKQLSVEKREQIEATLNEAQKKHLDRHIQNSVYDKWISDLVDSGKIKNVEINSIDDLRILMDEYEFIERKVAYDGQNFVCDEGHKGLKNLFIIRHIEEDRIIKLGKTCLKNLTGLSKEVINALIKIFANIDMHYEEILLAYSEGEFEKQKVLLEATELPPTMLKQLKLGLPLSYSQQQKASKVINEFFRKKAYEKKKEIALDKMNDAQKEYFHTLNDYHQSNMVVNFQENINYNDGVDLELLDSDIRKRINLKLPLTDSQMGHYLYQVREVNRIKEEKAQRINRKNNMLSSFSQEQKAFFDGLAKDEQQYIEENYIDSSVKPANLNQFELNEETKKRLKLGMPLNSDQLIEYGAALTKFESVMEAKGNVYSYDDIVTIYKDLLADIKANKGELRERCPKTYRSLISQIRYAQNNGSTSKREIKLNLRSINRVMDWPYSI